MVTDSTVHVLQQTDDQVTGDSCSPRIRYKNLPQSSKCLRNCASQFNCLEWGACTLQHPDKTLNSLENEKGLISKFCDTAKD